LNKLVKIIDDMDEQELQKIKKDLDEGNIRKLVEKNLTIATDENKVCPVCHKPISSNDYILTFGPTDLRMKANFDALDCLENFLTGLKK